MYNIHSHYENIYQYLRTIIADPRLLYLYPYGSTQPENLEFQADNVGHRPGARGPLFVFYDQEPIYPEFNEKLLTHIKDNYLGPFIFVTTEKNSKPLDELIAKFDWPVVYYFHHIFAAHDWYRGYRYNSQLVEPQDRKLVKKYITFNRITSSKRVYRSLLISELIERNILDQGYVSYNDSCSEGGDFEENLLAGAQEGWYSTDVANTAIENIKSIALPLRIDYQEEKFIPNHSFVLSAIKETQESFLYLVTETCYWEHKCHLTEKIFKPIVSKMPFVLVGPAYNLEYLKSYGFKTFSDWWDESYDSIEDPIERMHAVGQVMQDISNRGLDELKAMLVEMIPVLEHNYKLFNSTEFVDAGWAELTENLQLAVNEVNKHPFPVPFDSMESLFSDSTPLN